MLILTRRLGESIYIGDEVRLTVLGVRGTQVRLGIDAPKDISVHREEIYNRIKQEGRGGTPRAGAGGAAAEADESGPPDADPPPEKS